MTRYRSPLLGLAEIAQATPKQLQDALGGPVKGDSEAGVSLVDCLRIIMAAASALAPYLHQKQPLAVEGAGVGMLTLIIERGARRTRPYEENDEKQHVSEDDPAMSEAEGRNE